jgi:hypothetical protein
MKLSSLFRLYLTWNFFTDPGFLRLIRIGFVIYLLWAMFSP